jgi:hypothetical protein
LLDADQWRLPQDTDMPATQQFPLCLQNALNGPPNDVCLSNASGS